MMGSVDTIQIIIRYMLFRSGFQKYFIGTGSSRNPFQTQQYSVVLKQKFQVVVVGLEEEQLYVLPLSKSSENTTDIRTPYATSTVPIEEPETLRVRSFRCYTFGCMLTIRGGYRMARG